MQAKYEYNTFQYLTIVVSIDLLSVVNIIYCIIIIILKRN